MAYPQVILNGLPQVILLVLTCLMVIKEATCGSQESSHRSL